MNEATVRNNETFDDVTEDQAVAFLEPDSSTASERNILELLGIFAASISGSMYISLALSVIPAADVLIGASAVCMVCTLVLVAVSYLNDVLIKPRTFNIVLVVAAVFIGVGSLLLLVTPLAALLVVFGFLALLVTWVNYLVIQRHFLLNLILMMVFVLIGASELFSMAVPSPVAIGVMATLFSFVSLIASYIAKSHYRSNIDSFLTRSESAQNMQTRKSNFSKTFADGVVMAVSFVLLTTSLDVENIDPLYGGALVIFAAIVTCLFRYTPNLNFEIFMNWHMVLIFAVLFLAFPLVEHGIIKLVISGLSFMVSVGFLLIVLAGMAEFAKTVKVSCYYEFGREGSFFFMGAVGGLLLFYIVCGLAPFVGADAAKTTSIFCSLSLVILVWLNIDIVKGGYPLPKEFSAAKEKRTQPGRGASWKVKINLAAQKYALSPRQKEVMELLARGRNASYIMNKLCISSATVKSHIYSIYRKLGIHTQQELIDLIEEIEEENSTFPS